MDCSDVGQRFSDERDKLDWVAMKTEWLEAASQEFQKLANRVRRRL